MPPLDMRDGIGILCNGSIQKTSLCLARCISSCLVHFVETAWLHTFLYHYNLRNMQSLGNTAHESTTIIFIFVNAHPITL